VGGFSIVTRSLLARRPVVLAGPFDAERLARLVDALGVTLFSAVPAMIRRLLDLEPRWKPAPRLRAVLAGGGPMPARLLEEAWDRGLPVIPSYGLTETCSQIAAWPYGARPPAPVAKPLRGAEVRVTEGRIRVRGPMLFTSYLPGAEDRSPFSAGGWFDTGDLGALDADGFLRVLGRADDTIVTGGENVSPVEIEREIESFPGVRTASVFGVEDETWGEIVAAAIVLEPERTLDREALAAHLARSLAPHKRPRLVAVLPSLPLGPGGKVDRRAVARAAKPALRELPPTSR
jgi:O-succinylbenzoic acid--CoA ligase